LRSLRLQQLLVGGDLVLGLGQALVQDINLAR
jgi:hypothetical protein